MNAVQAMTSAEEVFWVDLRADLQDPEFAAEYEAHWRAIREADMRTVIKAADEHQ